MEKPDDTSLIERVTSLLEQNIRGVQLGIYGVAFVGLGVALRSVRPFAKFKNPSEIPKSFFDSRLKLSGKVTGIEINPSRPFLLVDHFPVLFSRVRRSTTLPVEIEGIDITGNGISWLQTIISGQNIDFILLESNPRSVSCIVHHKNGDVARHLLSVGFASVAPFNEKLSGCQLYSKYYENLLKEEARAEKRKVGMWWDQKPPSYLDVLSAKIIVKISSSLPKFLKLT